MRQRVLVAAVIAVFIALFMGADRAWSHDVITTKITWNREIVRIVNARCSSCHKEGGSAFSLTGYSQARPWAKAIQEEVLERRMPPWGAVKGFGEFRDDQALTPEQIEVVADWVEGGAPEGEDKDLPAAPKPNGALAKPVEAAAAAGAAQTASGTHKEVALSGDHKFMHDLVLGGMQPSKVLADMSFQVTAELPDGSVLPLLWLEPFKPAFSHPFWFKNPVKIPAGTVIRGVPATASVLLLPAP